jgi:hypothetical protein
MLTTPRSVSFGKNFWLLLTICAAQCAAQMLRGTVHNGTDGKPSSGDPILLMNGTHEISRTVSGENGDFRIESQFPSQTSPVGFKVRVMHDGVSYQQPIKFGAAAADITVYDGATRVDGLSEYLSIFQFEARTADRLVVTELHAIQNDSWPPRTSINPESFDVALPAGAHNLLVTIEEAESHAAKISIADASIKHGPHKFGIPLKPGLTKCVLTYELPYLGELRFRRSAQYSTKKTFIVLPKSMGFTAPATLHFHSVLDETGAQVREIDSLAEHDVLAFQIAGTGALAQAFRPMGGRDEPHRQTIPPQPAKVESLPSNTSQTSPASVSQNQKAVQPAAHSELLSQTVRNWAISGFVLLMLGSLIAWRVSHAKSRHGAA